MPGDRQSQTERVRLAERRRNALYLHGVRRLTVPEIAQVLKVSPRTVKRDLRAARSKARAQLEQEAEAAERVSDLAYDIDATYQATLREAWAAYHTSPEHSAARLRALNTILAATEKRSQHLRALGLLKQVPESLALALSMFGLTDEELAARIKQLEKQP